MSLGSLHSILHNETMALDGEVMFNFFKDLVSGMRFLHAHEPPLIHAGTANLLAQVHIMDSSNPPCRPQVTQLPGRQPLPLKGG